MKTKEKILVVSLELFNELGIANLAAIDVANEMDISPGNLYYHYKGKGEILATLLERYERTLQDGFRNPIRAANAGEESWLYFYALAELMYNYRFLFRSIADIKESFPDVERCINRILLSKFNVVSDILTAITTLDDSAPSDDLPMDAVMVMLLNWFNYRGLANPGEPIQSLIHSLMVRIERLLLPYCSIEMCGYMRLSNENYAAG
ncbi:MAG: TetR/AcrR family transcriptional regulator [Gammaproteobacteria bacterium]|uniref:TetR/AcrR family transcriptional regulator n=1 Tax=Pseudomaricurvus alcaniphilus TaxID=1166482 RepID=UPI00140D580B|nr:TetR/AcrR family transcriptional regulator [Pseudomaricurvus alcaniphilus]MBR9910110.1 TetR/AcrR family transcriptional regulator [Gammaproteobacteria bacterium]NHN36626.1 TetR/AcrR family transcriptional regulator [Pseudomaricurvus alcaniphilus]